MKIIITQYYTPELKELFDLTSPINIGYAEKNGYEYISDTKRRCPDRMSWWEKISWLQELSSSVEENSLIVYEDCDSVNMGGDITSALTNNTEFGMVQMRGGLGGKQLINWYNSGVIIMKNTKAVKSFLERVWKRNDKSEETSLLHELKYNNYTIGPNNPICNLDVEWNAWRNNLSLGSGDIKIRSWHGLKPENKITQIRDFIKSNKIS